MIASIPVRLGLLRLLVAGLVGLAAVSAQTPSVTPRSQEPRHTLWEVRDHGTTIAWLLGSIHALRATDYPLAPAIDRAFTQSKSLVEEVDLGLAEAPVVAQLIATKGLLPAGDTLERHLTTATWRALTTRGTAAGLPTPLLKRMKPWMAALSLMGPTLQRAGLDPAHGVDLHFYRRARAASMPVIGLETAEFQFDRLDGLSDAEQAALLEATIKDLDTQLSSIDALTRAWKDGDVMQLERLLVDSLADSPTAYARLVTDRNRAWISPIADCGARTPPCLVVVGAAHLIGRDGLVALLRARGLTVEQR